MTPLSKRIAFVSGAASGIGRAIATELAARGARVYLGDLDADAARAAASAIEGAHALHVDVTDRASVEAARDHIFETHGRVDVAIANAGVSSMNRFLDLTDAEWNQNLSVNATGSFITLQTFARRMADQPILDGDELRGKLVATASMAARAAAPLLAHYSASKFAVVGLVQAAAKELGPLKLTFNAVNPGFVSTGMQERELRWEASLRDMTPEAVFDEYVALTPLGRIESPHDVARAVAFLASPDSDFMTGEVLEVNGGAYMT